MEERFIKLVSTTYRIVDFFPESDPLKNRIKGKVLSIVDNLTTINVSQGWASFSLEKTKMELIWDIEMLLHYLMVARSQGWLNATNYFILRQEYSALKSSIHIDNDFTKKLTLDTMKKGDSLKRPFLLPKSDEKNQKGGHLSPRQKKILTFLQQNQKAQVMDLQKALPEVTKRTIRRDLDELLKLKKIERFGAYNQVFYKLIG